MSTILVACERESEQQVLEQALARRGHRVLKSLDGTEAFELARHERPDLVLSNVTLPRMDGFALFRKCQQDEHLQAVPFIFYSPRHSDPKYQRFAMELGAKRFIPGALKAEPILQAIEETLAALPQPKAAVAEPPVQPSQASDLAQENEAQRIRQQLSEGLHELEALQAKLAGAARFSKLFEANPAAMWLVERQSRAILAVNDAALSLFGYTRPEFVAMTADGLLSGGETATFGATTVITYRHKDGRTLSLLTVSRDTEFDGRAAEIMVAHDVSYRIRAERKVVEEAQRLRALFAALPDALCMVDGDGRILDANDRYCEQSGYSRDELARLTLAELESETQGLNGERRYRALHRHKNGTPWTVDVTASLPEAQSRRRVLLIRPLVQPPAVQPAVRPETHLPLAAELLREGADLDEGGLLRLTLTALIKTFGRTAVTVCVAQSDLQDPRVLAMYKQGKWSTGAALRLSAQSLMALRANSVFISAVADETQIELDGESCRGALLCVAPLNEHECLLLLQDGGASDEMAADEALALTRLLAWLIARKRAHAQTLVALHRADVTVQAMVDVLCRVCDQHDPYTAGSSNRVAALAVAMARLMGLGGEQQHTVYLGARLHDIGSIGIPKEILGRPLLLGEHEMALVRTHAELGAKLLSGIDLGADIAEVVRQHHERLDGSGYPRGLKQESILIEARIVAVADVIEAMCSPRPHRQALGLEAALNEIAQGSGTLYDSAAAAACLRLFKDDGFQWPVMSDRS